MPDSSQRLARFTTNLPRLRARAEMIIFLRRMAWLCVAIVVLVVAGTVGFVVTEGTSAWTGFRWTLDSQADDLELVLRPLVESAVSLMTSPRMALLRRCGNETCYWLFIDETKNCSRRWCEMASCGNLMKVRRHRERHRRD